MLKYAKGKRILFLVNTKNLGEQAEGEFRSFTAKEYNRLFTELYNVTRLNSSFIPSDRHVYISTIQRMYSILKGTDLDEQDEVENPNETHLIRKEPLPVVYNEKVPMEFLISLLLMSATYYPRIAVTVDMIATGQHNGKIQQRPFCDY